MRPKLCVAPMTSDQTDPSFPGVLGEQGAAVGDAVAGERLALAFGHYELSVGRKLDEIEGRLGRDIAGAKSLGQVATAISSITLAIVILLAAVLYSLNGKVGAVEARMDSMERFLADLRADIEKVSVAVETIDRRTAAMAERASLEGAGAGPPLELVIGASNPIDTMTEAERTVLRDWLAALNERAETWAGGVRLSGFGVSPETTTPRLLADLVPIPDLEGPALRTYRSAIKTELAGFGGSVILDPTRSIGLEGSPRGEFAGTATWSVEAVRDALDAMTDIDVLGLAASGVVLSPNGDREER